MPPKITREGGLPPPNEGDANSALIFSGIKFWVSQQVPMRNHFVGLISSNGGQVLKTETNADVRIVDHARSLPVVPHQKPYHSYKIIEDSVREGELTALERYEVKPKSKAGTTKSGGPGKSAGFTATVKAANGGPRSRHFFTDDDDLLLMRYLCRPGVALSGNKIYQEIAEKHGIRSFHGWRGRWVDKLSKDEPDPYIWLSRLCARLDRDEDNLSDLELEEPQERSTKRQKIEKETASSKIEKKKRKKEAASPKIKRVVVTPNKPRLLPPTFQQSSAIKSNPPPPSSASGRVEQFSKKDDKLLRDLSRTLKYAKDEMEVWMDFQDDYPHHTVKQWRQRYNTVILPTLTTSKPIPALHLPPPVLIEGELEPEPFEHGYTPPPQPHRPNGHSSPHPSSIHIEQWRANVLPSAPPSSAIKPRQQKRVRASVSNSGLSPDVVVPSTPDPSPRIHPREPSPELGLEISELPDFSDLPDFPESVKAEETEDADLTVPPLGSSPTPSEAETSAEDEVADLERFVKRMQEEYNADSVRVIYAIERAGAQKAQTEIILRAEKSGEEFPSHIDGIWTEEEDKILEGADGREIEKLAARKADWKERLEFLAKWRAAD